MAEKKVSELISLIPNLEAYDTLAQSVSENLSLDGPLRVAVTGIHNIDVLNCLVKEFLFPNLKECCLELHYSEWPKICWYTTKDNELKLDDVLHIDDCASWKVLKRAAYLKQMMGQVQAQTLLKQKLKKVEIHYPFQSPFSQKVILTTECDSPPAQVIFTACNVRGGDGEEVIALSGTTGICQAVQPHKALMNFIANTDSEEARYFTHVVNRMMCPAVTKMEEARKRDRQLLLESTEQAVEVLKKLAAQANKLATKLSESANAKPLNSVSNRTDAASQFNQCTKTVCSQTVIISSSSSNSQTDGVHKSSVYVPTQGDWKPAPSSWTPPATSWLPHQSGWEPPKSSWQPPKDVVYHPPPSDWKPSNIVYGD